MIVGDTSWIVALRDPEDPHHEAALAVDQQIGDEPVTIAAVTLAECLVAPAMMGALDAAEAALRAAFEIDRYDDDAPRRWAGTRAETGLRLPDAIVLATAVRRGARGVATFDARLAQRCRTAGLDVISGESDE
jgi:predicted nucleic acid-binding protein